MKEPLWRLILNWGTVISFLTVPLIIMSIQVYANTHPGWWQWNDALTPEQHQSRFQYLNDFMRNITILVFGLAGLRTWENIKNGKGQQSDPRAPRHYKD
jgi:hypothetical protein